jgi:hypothetical protein
MCDVEHDPFLRVKTYTFLNGPTACVLPSWVKKLAKDPVFRRLNYLYQLGLVYFLCPAATHTRFAHSLGVAYTAHELLAALHRAHGRSLGLTRADVNTVVFAALCHDLGHGPISHAYEKFMRAARPTCEWEHEHQSGVMIEFMLNRNNGALRKLITAPSVGVNVDVALAMIRGDASGVSADKQFLFDIVNNKTSGLDVDKLDYLVRDAHTTGQPVTVEVTRLLCSARVMRNAAGRTCIAWPHELASTVQAVFQARQDLHLNVIQHPCARAAEYMALEALRCLAECRVVPGSDVVLADAHAHPEVYEKLTDVLLNAGMLGLLQLPANATADEVGGFARASAMFARLHMWDFVRFCGEMTMTPTSTFTDWSAERIAADLAARSGVKVDSIFVHIATSSRGKGKLNPVAYVPLFQKVAARSKAGAGAGSTAAAGSSFVLDVDYDFVGESPEPELVLVHPDAVHYARPSTCELHKLLVFADTIKQQKPVQDALLAWARDVQSEAAKADASTVITVAVDTP